MKFVLILLASCGFLLAGKGLYTLGKISGRQEGAEKTATWCARRLHTHGTISCHSGVLYATQTWRHLLKGKVTIEEIDATWAKCEAKK